MIQQPIIEKKKYIQSLPFGNVQTIAFTHSKEITDERGKLFQLLFIK